MHKFTDALEIAGTRRRKEDGALIVDARTARTGIQVYAGSEVGRPDMNMVRVFRPASEVFSDETLKSFAHRPITNDHPREPVNADNWKKYSVGQSGDEVSAQDRFVRVPLMVSDGAAIKDIESGKRELSPGYMCDIEWTPGKTDAGETYDAVQKNIRINHIAIVARGRSGPEVRIGDDATAWGPSPITLKDTKMTTKQMWVDGLPIEVTDQAEAMINRMTKDAEALRKQLSDATAQVAAVTTAKDEEIGGLKAEITKLKDAAPDAVAIDKLVAARSALIDAARIIDKDIKTEGVTDAEIRKTAVRKKMGDAAVEGVSDAEIAGMFKVLAKDNADTFRQTMRNTTQDTSVTVSDERAAWLKSTDFSRKEVA